MVNSETTTSEEVEEARERVGNTIQSRFEREFPVDIAVGDGRESDFIINVQGDGHLSEDEVEEFLAEQEFLYNGVGYSLHVERLGAMFRWTAEVVEEGS